MNRFSQVFASVDSSNSGNDANGDINSSNLGDETNVNDTNTKTSSHSDKMNNKHGQNLEMLQPHVLHVSTRQRGNGLLRFIRNVPYSYQKIKPDYILGSNRCALFLSCKYHNLHPNYIHRRISEIQSDFDLRVLLCLVDVEDNASILLYLNKMCVINNMTLILAWSEEEAARYLETFKAFEGKDASLIQKRKETTFVEQVIDSLKPVKSVNKTDCGHLLQKFGSFKGIVTASINEIGSCEGIGEKKVKRLYDAFNRPFSTSIAKKRRLELGMKVESEINACDDYKQNEEPSLLANENEQQKKEINSITDENLVLPEIDNPTDETNK